MYDLFNSEPTKALKQHINKNHDQTMQTNNQLAKSHAATGVTERYRDLNGKHANKRDLTTLQPVLTRATWTRPDKGTQFCCEN